nr:pentatricopeptide repeat-containing protein At1g25360-like [Ipomoea trifida]
MPEKNSLTWTMMISGCSQNGLGEEGLRLFNQMKFNGVESSDYAFAGAIASCLVLAALETGRQLHAQIIRCGFDSSLSAGNALITFYGFDSICRIHRKMQRTLHCLLCYIEKQTGGDAENM